MRYGAYRDKREFFALCYFCRLRLRKTNPKRKKLFYCKSSKQLVVVVVVVVVVWVVKHLSSCGTELSHRSACALRLCQTLPFSSKHPAYRSAFAYATDVTEYPPHLSGVVWFCPFTHIRAPIRSDFTGLGSREIHIRCGREHQSRYHLLYQIAARFHYAVLFSHSTCWGVLACFDNCCPVGSSTTHLMIYSSGR